MHIDLSEDLRELEATLNSAPVDAIEADDLAITTAASLASGAIAEIARQFALVRTVDPDIFTNAVIARVALDFATNTSANLARRVYSFRMLPQ